MVGFDYTPEEPAQHYGDAPYPGCPESIDIGEVFVGDVDIFGLLSDEAIAGIEQKLWEERS